LGSRTATSTITVVDQYCDAYRDLFTEVRTFENFKHLHVGMLSDIKRKSLPEIAKAVGLHDSHMIPCRFSLCPPQPGFKGKLVRIQV
jgi:SRSO17 transposase